MVKKQGESLKPHETKSYIIKHILERDGHVGEPDIRDHLKKKHGLIDQGTINRHLHYLKNEGLIELLPQSKGLRNKWDITKIEHLLNIKRKIKEERLNKIDLNKHEKSLMIVLKKNGYDIFTFKGIRFYVQLLLSSSFFNACLDTNVETLCDRAQLINAYKNPLDAQEVKETISNCYLSYKNCYPILGISIESFMSMIKQMSLREISFPEKIIMMENPRIVPKSFTEEFMKIWEEELFRTSKETLDHMHKEPMERDLRVFWEMAVAAYKLKSFNSVSEAERYDLLFEPYLYQDMLGDIASEEEISYAIEKRSIEEEFRNATGAIRHAMVTKFWEGESRNSTVDTNDYERIESLSEHQIIRDLELESRILSRYKHPSVFGNIYDDPLTTCRGIFKFLYQQTDQIKSFMPLYERESTSFFSNETAWDKWNPNFV
jgi:hypothetical protein